jgi:sugar O-acyltransferase (sialic acid O-acetyltransferase NeuD family)
VTNRLLIAGAGGHGKVVAEAAQATGRWSEFAFADNQIPIGTRVLGIEVVGPFDGLAVLLPRYAEAVVALGDAQLRERLQSTMEAIGYSIATIVHPRATVSPTATLGRGSVVFAQAVINAHSILGLGCIINTASSVDHDCELADFVHVCPGAHLAGGVAVGARTWIGIGAAVIQKVRIGTGCRVGAGAVVIRDIPDHATVAGVPAQPVRSAPE